MSSISLNKQSTTKGFAILSIAGLVGKILSLFYMPFLRKILGDQGIGIYGYSYNIYVFLYVITNSGIPVAISKTVSELIALGNYKDAIKSFKMARMLLFIIGLVTSLLMFFYAGALCKFIKSPSSTLAVMALSPTILVTAVLSTYRGYFQGRGNMTPTAVSQVIEQVVNISFSLAFAAYFQKIYGMEAGVAGGTIGTSLGALVAVIILIYFYEKNKSIRVVLENPINPKRLSNKRLFKKLLHYSVPMTVCIGLQNAGLLLDPKIVKSRLLFSGFAQREADIRWGWFYQYNTLISVPITIIMSLAIAVLPAIASSAALRDKRALKGKISYAFRLCFLVSIPSAVGLMVLSKPICRLLGYSLNSAMLLSYGAGILVLMSIVQVQTSILQGLGKIYLVTIYSILGLIAKIIVNYFVVPMQGVDIKGVLVANAACFIIPLILNYITINQSLRIKISLWKRAIKPLVASIAMGVVAYLLHYVIYSVLSFISKGYIVNAFATMVSIVVGGYMYIYILILIRGIRKRDLQAMPSKAIKLIPKFMIEDIED